MKLGKIAAIKRERAECLKLMRTFCLDPSVEVYKRVVACDAVVRSDYYKTWAAMLPLHVSTVIVSDKAEGGPVDASRGDGNSSGKAESGNSSNGTVGGTVSANPNEEARVAAHKMKRDIAYRAIMNKANSAPTKAIALQLVYVFAATGWYEAIEKVYECMGDSRIPQTSRIEICEEYKAIKELYCDKIRELLTANKDHFTSRGINIHDVDFTRFDVYQREYEQKKAEGK